MSREWNHLICEASVAWRLDLNIANDRGSCFRDLTRSPYHCQPNWYWFVTWSTTLNPEKYCSTFKSFRKTFNFVVVESLKSHVFSNFQASKTHPYQLLRSQWLSIIFIKAHNLLGKVACSIFAGKNAIGSLKLLQHEWTRWKMAEAQGRLM